MEEAMDRRKTKMAEINLAMLNAARLRHMKKKDFSGDTPSTVPCDLQRRYANSRAVTQLMREWLVEFQT
jgi:hypothetical protein